MKDYAQNGVAVQAHAVTKSFGSAPHTVIHPTDLTIYQGEFVSIAGKSGSGKSTLLYMLSGLDATSSGRVEILGLDTNHLDQERVHRQRNTDIGFVFQFHYLLPELSSLENILMPARKTKQHIERLERAHKLLKDLEIDHCAHKLPSQISGGEQQRVAIARALIMEPRIIFADEPTGNLDSRSSEKAMNILQNQSLEHGRTVVYITHDEDHAQRAHRQIILSDGRIVSGGSAALS